MQWIVIIIAVCYVVLMILGAVINAISEWFNELEKNSQKKQHQKDYAAWHGLKCENELSNQQAFSAYEENHKIWTETVKKEQEELTEPLRQVYEEKFADWKKIIKQEQKEIQDSRNASWASENQAAHETYNSKMDFLNAKKAYYYNGQKEAVIFYNQEVLNYQKLPEGFPDEREMQYDEDNKCLILNFRLPSPEDIKKEKEWRYIKSKNEIKIVEISETALNKIYDDVIYQTTLSVINLIASADDADVIDYIAFNGWVRALNKSTGKMVDSCIVSMYIKKSDLNDIDFQQVDPKECFRSLKGIGNIKPHSITPVPPIMKIDTFDSRFVDSYGVVGGLDDTINLAAMDWEDFEHLVREIFEKEFAGNGGEVKVTQSSVDGGVDAVVFDPDPIKGGKIIIQAKRYTNVVGVSAVRDLHGTVQHEGAMKGILVTTSDFGPESHRFALNKPITLLNGSHLLHLLEKHGHKAKIDIKDAKRVLNLKENMTEK